MIREKKWLRSSRPVIRVDTVPNDPELTEAVSHLRAGGIVAAATESYFGLLADAENPRALDALFQLKGRDAWKGVALIVPGVGHLSRWGREVPELAHALAARFWPGPLTLAVSAAAAVDSRLQVDGSVGMRQPGNSSAARVVAAFGGALTATSANRAGEPPAVLDSEVTRCFGDAQGTLLVLAGSSPGGAPSTIVRVVGQRHEVVRPGAVISAAIDEAVAQWTPPVRSSR